MAYIRIIVYCSNMRITFFLNLKRNSQGVRIMGNMHVGYLTFSLSMLMF